MTEKENMQSMIITGKDVDRVFKAVAKTLTDMGCHKILGMLALVEFILVNTSEDDELHILLEDYRRRFIKEAEPSAIDADLPLIPPFTDFEVPPSTAVN